MGRYRSNITLNPKPHEDDLEDGICSSCGHECTEVPIDESVKGTTSKMECIRDFAS